MQRPTERTLWKATRWMPPKRPKAGAPDLYHGTLGLFLDAGFEVVSDAVPGRAVVRLRVGPPSSG